MNAFFLASTAFQPGSRAPAAPVLRHASPLAVFRTPGSTDQAVADQQRRAEAAGLTPKEYEEATRRAAKEYLDASGAHAMPADGSAAAQRASFLPQLWGVDSIPAVPAEAAADEARVLATFYEIGGPLTSVLSTSVAKQLPMIPHVGIRVHGVEYFYSDHIECRTVPVMEEMLGDRPQARVEPRDRETEPRHCRDREIVPRGVEPRPCRSAACLVPLAASAGDHRPRPVAARQGRGRGPRRQPRGHVGRRRVPRLRQELRPFLRRARRARERGRAAAAAGAGRARRRRAHARLEVTINQHLTLN